MNNDAMVFVTVLLTIGLVSFILIGIPLWRICSRAGFNPAWSLLAVIPYLGPTIVAARLGLSKWPKFTHLRTPGG
jgi:hypothetical protein